MLRVCLAFMGMAAWWRLLPAAVLPGLRRAARTRFDEALPALVFVAGLGTVYSLLFSNIGLIFRRRSQLLPWLLAVAAVALEARFRAVHGQCGEVRPATGCEHGGI